MRFWVGNTDERTLPVRNAAHIRPYAELGPHRLENGVLMRKDLAQDYSPRQEP